MRTQLLSIPEVARYLRVDIEDINYEIDQGQVETIAIGTKVRVSRTALQTYLHEHNIPDNIIGRSRVSRWWLYAGILVLAVSTVVVAMEFPFPEWQAETITPQTAVFRAADAVTEGDPERYAPINAPLDYRRYNEAANPDGRGFTHSLLSLQQQNAVAPGSLSFPWTLFINLDTDHDRGDGVGNIVNLHNRGSGWATGFHVDSFAWGTGTTLGSNIEMLDVSDQGAYTVGMNIQNKAFRGNIGLQVQVGPLPETHRLWQPGMDGGWQTGIKLSGQPGFAYFGTGLELGRHTEGQRGIWLRGQYDTGIDLGNNDLSMNAGAVLRLAADDAVAMHFDKAAQRIEFTIADQVIAFLPVASRNINLAR